MFQISTKNKLLPIIVTRLLRELCGSYGSRLHLADNGEWVGYAQWPDEETRENCDADTEELDRARKLMRDAVEFRYPDSFLKIKGDLLLHPRTDA